MKPTGPRLRRVHERVWTVATGTLIAAGLIAALHQPGVLASIALFLSASTMGMLVTIAFEPEELPGAELLRRMFLGGLVGGGLLVSLVGLSVTFGPGAAWPVGLCLLTCPDLHRWVRVLLGRDAVPEPAPTPPPPARRATRRPAVAAPPPAPLPDDEVESFVVPDVMGDDDLCRAWCSSYVALQRAETEEARMRVVGMRAIYLDEIERRHPEAFAAWLAAGARASQDPRRFLGRGPNAHGQV
jgi:hypothetical protein